MTEKPADLLGLTDPVGLKLKQSYRVFQTQQDRDTFFDILVYTKKKLKTENYSYLCEMFIS